VWIKETENSDHFCHRLATQVLSRICVEGVAYIIGLVVQKMQVPVIDRSLFAPEYQKRPTLSDVMIDWHSMKAKEICNLIRACNPWNKGAITFFKGEELKLMDAMVVKEETGSHGTLPAGSIIISDNRLYVSCIDGKMVNINMLYYQDIYVPAYFCEKYGFSAGNRFSNMS
jgi:methionyl-tRNA formyltransferase